MTAVLVTGGAGFIGSHIVEELLRRGDNVRVLDNFSSGRRENLQGLKGSLEILEGDLCDREKIAQAVQGIEWIFHQAAMVSVAQSMRDPGFCFEVNTVGTVNLLEAARRSGVRKIVLASSTAVYGDTDRFPTSESTGLKPLSPYAVSKQVNEVYARLYTDQFGLKVTALRYFNVYGPRQRPDSDYAAAIPIFLHRLIAGQELSIYGDGKQSRDFIFVKDVVAANLLAAESDSDAGEAINVCTGHETRIMDLIEELSEITSSNPEVKYEPPRPGDIYRSVGSPEKARQLLGFQAATPISEGLRQTIHWMKS